MSVDKNFKKESRQEKSEYYQKYTYQFEDRLVLKLVGNRRFILRFLKDLHKLYPATAFNVSPLKGDNINPQQTCFINIFYAEVDKQNKDTGGSEQ